MAEESNYKGYRLLVGWRSMETTGGSVQIGPHSVSGLAQEQESGERGSAAGGRGGVAQQVMDFTSEDDLNTFDGWLRYQGIDSKILAPDQLAMWRDHYDEVREQSLATPKVGLMKLRNVPGEHRYG